MVKFMKKIPAGTLIVPMLLSALLHTLWPDLLHIGGITEDFLGGRSINFIIGMLTFSSGLGIDFENFKKILKRQGLIMLLKVVVSVAVSILFISLFGQSGIFGVSAIAFTVAMVSMNPALYISLVDDFGTEVDKAAFGFTGLFSIPIIPVLIYSFDGQGAVDWMPILSTIIPLILGIALGNLDPEMKDFFSGAIPIMLPMLGWNMGQSMNLIDAFNAGLSGIILAIFYFVIMYSLVIFDKNILKNDGVSAMAMNSVAALSTSVPAIIAQTIPELQQYVPSAIAQILMCNIISVFVTPIIVRRLAERKNRIVA